MTELIDYLVNFQPGDWVGMSLRGVFLYVFVVWIAVVIWVARDSVSRSRSLVFQVLMILGTIALNVFGLLVYLIIRPQKTLVEKYHEELERKALAENEESCPTCSKHLPLEFQFCPHCGEEVRHPCKKCKGLVSKNWTICPYCGAERPNAPVKKPEPVGEILKKDSSA